MAMKKYTSVSEYLDDYSGKHLTYMKQIIELVTLLEPTAKPSIARGMPAYVLDDIVVAFYAYKHHVSLYPFNTEVIDRHRGLQGDHAFAKGTFQISTKFPFPEKTVRSIIEDKLRNM